MCHMIATGSLPFMFFALASARLRRPAARRVAPLLRTRSSRGTRSSLDSLSRRLVETAADELGIERREEPTRLRTVGLSEEREVDRRERVARDLAVLRQPDALGGLVQLVLHRLGIGDLPDERSRLREETTLRFGEREIAGQLGQHGEPGLRRGPAREPLARERHAALEIGALGRRQRSALP